MKQQNKKQRTLAQRNALLGYLFTAQWVIGFLAFSIFPLLFSLFMSTQKVNISGEGLQTKAVGFGNFSYAFTLDFKFLMAIVSSVKTAMILTPLIIILALILSMLLNQKIYGRSFFRGIYFLPVIIISGALLTMLQSNGVFEIINLQDSTLFRFLDNSQLGMVSTIIAFLLENIFTVLWFSGVQILIYLSGLQKNSKDVYEAASIDGASKWQMFWKITLPSMHQFTIINTVYTVVLLATFPTSEVMLLVRESMFGTATHQGLGYASALSWIYFIVIVLMLLVFLFVLGVRPDVKKRRAK